MDPAGSAGVYYDKANPSLRQSVRKKEKAAASPPRIVTTRRDESRQFAARSVAASLNRSRDGTGESVEVTGLFSSDKLLENRRSQRKHLGRRGAGHGGSSGNAGVGEAVGSRFNFVNLAQQYSQSQGRDTMREQLRQARGVTVPELFEQASRDNHGGADSADTSFGNSGVQGRGNAHRGGDETSFDDFSMGSAGRAPGLDLRDFGRNAPSNADSSAHDNEAYVELDDDVAKLKAELARLRQQKEKILRSPLETLTATSFVTPSSPAASYRAANGGAGGADNEIIDGMHKIREEAQKALNEMWGSPFKNRANQDQQNQQQQQHVYGLPPSEGASFSEDEEPRSNVLPAAEVSIQSAEELYNYVQQAQRASGLSSFGRGE